MTGQAIVLDLETRPDPQIAQSEDWWARVRQSIEAPSNWVDQGKILNFKQEKELKLREQMALSPLTGLIACIGWKDVRTGEGVGFVVESETREEEGQMLFSFLESLPVSEHAVVGWNIKRFDLPFLTGRSLLHDVELPKWWPSPRDYRRCVDLLDILDGKLDDWSFLLRGRFKDVDGPDLLKLPLAELYKHMLDDLEFEAHIAACTMNQWSHR